MADQNENNPNSLFKVELGPTTLLVPADFPSQALESATVFRDKQIFDRQITDMAFDYSTSDEPYILPLTLEERLHYKRLGASITSQGIHAIHIDPSYNPPSRVHHISDAPVEEYIARLDMRKEVRKTLGQSLGLLLEAKVTKELEADSVADQSALT